MNTVALPAGVRTLVTVVYQCGKHDLLGENVGSNPIIGWYTVLNRTTGVETLNASSAPRTQAVSSGESLENVPVIPGSLRVTGTALPTLVDKNADGILRPDRVVGTALVTSSAGATSVPATRRLTDATKNFRTAGVLIGDQVRLSSSQDTGGYTVVTRVSDTVLELDRDFPVGSKSAVSYVVYAADLALGTVAHATGKLTFSYPAGSAPAAKSTILSTGTFPMDLEAGKTLTVALDGGGATTATFTAVAAKVAGAAATFAAMAAETMDVQFESGETQTITFGTEATQALAVALLNEVLEGGRAVVNGANVDIYSDVKGTGSRVRLTNVAAGITTKLGLADNADAAGTGNVVNVNAVQFAETKALIELAVANVSATLEAGKLRLSNTTASVGVASTIQIGGTARTKVGFVGTVVTGAAAPEQNLTASYFSTISSAPGATVNQQVLVPANSVCRIYAFPLGGSSILKYSV